MDNILGCEFDSCKDRCDVCGKYHPATQYAGSCSNNCECVSKNCETTIFGSNCGL